MATQISNLGFMGIAILLDIAVTLFIVRRLCKSKLVCSFSGSSLVLFNLLILIFCSILIRLDISMGTGVGLFAVMAMFRFRSEVLKTEEMFYLLLLIGLAFVHAAFPTVLSLTEVLCIDAILVGVSIFVTYKKRQSNHINISIDNIDIVQPANEEKVRHMLQRQIGHEIGKIKVININLKKRRSELLVEVLESHDSEPKSTTKLADKPGLVVMNPFSMAAN